MQKLASVIVIFVMHIKETLAYAPFKTLLTELHHREGASNN